MREFTVESRKRTEFIDITAQIGKIVSQSGARHGICTVYAPHTTAGILINEHADPDVTADLERALEKLVPWNAGYAHAEGNSSAHVKSSMLGCSQTVGVEEGKLMLGTWQGIFFAEFDGPRTRKVWVTVIE